VSSYLAPNLLSKQAAKKRGVSSNYEMASRLEHSFEREASRSNEMIVEEMKVVWAHYGAVLHELAKQGDLLRTAEALIAQIEANRASAPEAIVGAADQLKKVIFVVDHEAAIARRKMTAL
jgi:hypothetical protein